MFWSIVQFIEIRTGALPKIAPSNVYESVAGKEFDESVLRIHPVVSILISGLRNLEHPLDENVGQFRRVMFYEEGKVWDRDTHHSARGQHSENFPKEARHASVRNVLKDMGREDAIEGSSLVWKWLHEVQIVNLFEYSRPVLVESLSIHLPETKQHRRKKRNLADSDMRGDVCV